MSEWSEKPARGYVALVNRSFRLLPFEDVAHNHLCSHCAALHISNLVIPCGQPHVESLTSLKRSASRCPLCKYFALIIFLRLEDLASSDHESANGPMVCHLEIVDGISTIYLAYDLTFRTISQCLSRNPCLLGALLRRKTSGHRDHPFGRNSKIPFDYISTL